MTGIGFDRDVLRRGGDRARPTRFAAVSSGDNSNIIAARVARETFGVEQVVARIYDPRRAEVYQRLGIPTVATVRWTADQMLRKLLPESAEPLWRDPTGKVVLAEVAVAPTGSASKVKRARGVGRRPGSPSSTRLGEAMRPAARHRAAGGRRGARDRRGVRRSTGSAAPSPSGPRSGH